MTFVHFCLFFGPLLLLHSPPGIPINNVAAVGGPPVFDKSPPRERNSAAEQRNAPPSSGCSSIQQQEEPRLNVPKVNPANSRRTRRPSLTADQLNELADRALSSPSTTQPHGQEEHHQQKRPAAMQGQKAAEMPGFVGLFDEMHLSNTHQQQLPTGLSSSKFPPSTAAAVPPTAPIAGSSAPQNERGGRPPKSTSSHASSSRHHRTFSENAVDNTNSSFSSSQSNLPTIEDNENGIPKHYPPTETIYDWHKLRLPVHPEHLQPGRPINVKEIDNEAEKKFSKIIETIDDDRKWIMLKIKIEYEEELEAGENGETKKKKGERGAILVRDLRGNPPNSEEPMLLSFGKETHYFDKKGMSMPKIAYEHFKKMEMERKAAEKLTKLLEKAEKKEQQKKAKEMEEQMKLWAKQFSAPTPLMAPHNAASPFWSPPMPFITPASSSAPAQFLPGTQQTQSFPVGQFVGGGQQQFPLWTTNSFPYFANAMPNNMGAYNVPTMPNVNSPMSGAAAVPTNNRRNAMPMPTNQLLNVPNVVTPTAAAVFPHNTTSSNRPTGAQIQTQIASNAMPTFTQNAPVPIGMSMMPNAPFPMGMSMMPNAVGTSVANIMMPNQLNNGMLRGVPMPNTMNHVGMQLNIDPKMSSDKLKEKTKKNSKPKPSS